MSDDEKLLQELDAAKAELEQKQEEIQVQEESAPVEESTDPYLEEAVKNGYNPKYDGIDKKTPEQYVRDGSFFKKINHQKKEINELKDAIRDLSRQYSKSEKVGYERAIQELHAKRDAAIEIGDKETVHELDHEINKVNTELQKPEPVIIQEEQQVQETHPAALDFKEKNATWFGKYDASKNTTSLSDEEKENLEMTETALVYDDYLGKAIAEGRVNYTPEQAVKMVEDRIKKYYPHRFENPKKSEPAAVGKPSLGSSSQSGTSNLVSRLTEHQKSMHQLYLSVDSKFGSLEDYAKGLEKIGELK